MLIDGTKFPHCYNKNEKQQECKETEPTVDVSQLLSGYTKG
jgi:hypothetical protein